MTDRKKIPPADEVLIEAAKSTLDDKLGEMDDEVRQRLRQMRAAAVGEAAAHGEATPSKSATLPVWLVPAGGLAVMALVISGIFYSVAPGHDPSPVASIEDMPILTAPEELELYEELDFYQWLARDQDGVG